MSVWFQVIHRDEAGQMMPAIWFGMIGAALLIYLLMNTGARLNDRIDAQNGADAVVIAQADWGARSLNVISMNNVSLTQMHTIFWASAAFQATLVEMLSVASAVKREVDSRCDAAGNIARGICAASIIGAPFAQGCYNAAYNACQGVHAAANAGVAFTRAMSASFNLSYAPGRGMVIASRAINALNKMNEFVVREYPAISRVVTERIAGANEMADYFVYPTCDPNLPEHKNKGSCKQQSPDLPLATNSGSTKILQVADLCVAASSGTGSSSRKTFAKRGFAQGKGPYSGGGKDGMHLKDHINKELTSTGFLSRVGVNLWNLTDSLDIGDTLMENDFAGFLALFSPSASGAAVFRIGRPPDYRFVQRTNSNIFTDGSGSWMQRLWTAGCAAGGLSALGGIGGGMFGSINMDIVPKTYWLKGKSFTQTAGEATGSALGGILGQLASEFTAHREDFSQVAFVAKKPTWRILPNRFLEPYGQQYSFAEAMIFNKSGYDLYTQDWRAKLVPMHLIENDTYRRKIRDEIKNKAPAMFKAISGLFDDNLKAEDLSIANTR